MNGLMGSNTFAAFRSVPALKPTIVLYIIYNHIIYIVAKNMDEKQTYTLKYLIFG